MQQLNRQRKPKITKDDFNEEVDFLGANIGFIHMALTQVPFLNILVAYCNC
jgi:hypothetical protein